MLNILLKRNVSKLIIPTSRNGLRMFATKTWFTKEHEWVKVDDATNEAVYGITNYAQKELGDIVYIDLPFAGDKFGPAEAIGAVESVKTSAQIYTPASVEVIENNKELEANPSLVNQDPYEKGWICKLKINEIDTSKLLDEKQYKKYLKDNELIE